MLKNQLCSGKKVSLPQASEITFNYNVLETNTFHNKHIQSLQLVQTTSNIKNLDTCHGELVGTATEKILSEDTCQLRFARMSFGICLDVTGNKFIH